MRSELRGVKFEVVPLPITIEIDKYSDPNLYSDSTETYLRITPKRLFIITSGRFSKVAEIGYKQVYKTIRRSAKYGKIKHYFLDYPHMLFLFKINNEYKVVRVKWPPVLHTFHDDWGWHGDKFDPYDKKYVILLDEYAGFTSHSGRTHYYYIKKHHLFKLRKMALAFLQSS